MNVATGLRLVVSFTSRLLYLPPGGGGGATPLPVGQEAGWATELVWTMGKTVNAHPLSECVNDWIIKEHECCDSWRRFPLNRHAVIKYGTYRIVNLLATEVQCLLSRALCCMCGPHRHSDRHFSVTFLSSPSFFSFHSVLLVALFSPHLFVLYFVFYELFLSFFN